MLKEDKAFRMLDSIRGRSHVFIIVDNRSNVVGRVYSCYGRSGYGASCRGVGVLYASFPGLDHHIIGVGRCRGYGYDMRATVVEEIIRSWATDSLVIRDMLMAVEASRSPCGISGLGAFSMLSALLSPGYIVLEA